MRVRAGGVECPLTITVLIGYGPLLLQIAWQVPAGGHAAPAEVVQMVLPEFRRCARVFLVFRENNVCIHSTAACGSMLDLRVAHAAGATDGIRDLNDWQRPPGQHAHGSAVGMLPR